MPGRTRFLRISVPVAVALMRHRRADSRASWPLDDHSRSCRSYLISFAVGGIVGRRCRDGRAWTKSPKLIGVSKLEVVSLSILREMEGASMRYTDGLITFKPDPTLGSVDNYDSRVF